MDNLLPKIKTIRVMLRDMNEQQEAVFRMGFQNAQYDELSNYRYGFC